jgi:hypothetical protein
MGIDCLLHFTSISGFRNIMYHGKILTPNERIKLGYVEAPQMHPPPDISHKRKDWEKEYDYQVDAVYFRVCSKDQKTEFHRNNIPIVLIFDPQILKDRHDWWFNTGTNHGHYYGKFGEDEQSKANPWTHGITHNYKTLNKVFFSGANELMFPTAVSLKYLTEIIFLDNSAIKYISDVPDDILKRVKVSQGKPYSDPFDVPCNMQRTKIKDYPKEKQPYTLPSIRPVYKHVKVRVPDKTKISGYRYEPGFVVERYKNKKEAILDNKLCWSRLEDAINLKQDYKGFMYTYG